MPKGSGCFVVILWASHNLLQQGGVPVDKKTGMWGLLPEQWDHLRFPHYPGQGYVPRPYHGGKVLHGATGKRHGIPDPKTLHQGPWPNPPRTPMSQTTHRYRPNIRRIPHSQAPMTRDLSSRMSLIPPLPFPLRRCLSWPYSPFPCDWLNTVLFRDKPHVRIILTDALKLLS